MADPIIIDPSEPTEAILSRLFFTLDGKSVTIGEPNKATASILRECERRFRLLSAPMKDVPFEAFREQMMSTLDIEGPYTVEGKSADWVTVWNVARIGADRCLTMAFTAAYAAEHRLDFPDAGTGGVAPVT